MHYKKEKWWQKSFILKYWQVFLILLLILIINIIIFIFQQKNNKQNNIIIEESAKQKSVYQYISPLLDCADSPGLYSRNLEHKLNQVIKDNIKNKKADLISLYYRDLNNGPWIGINENEKFSPASLLKVPLMMTYLKISEKNPEILNQKIKINNEESYIVQNIKPSREVKENVEYTIEELIQYMIIYSDNKASDALIKYTENIDIKILDKIYSDIGIAPPKIYDPENFMKIKDYSSFFRILYNSSYLNIEMSEKALFLLSQSEYKRGLRSNIPNYIQISHKFGERTIQDNKQLHDCGIIYKPNNPYILCVMTKGKDFNSMNEVIEEISQIVYKETYFR